MMAGLSDVAGDERTARMVLSMLVEPNDPVTGRVLNGLGAMETLRLAERDGAVVGPSGCSSLAWPATCSPGWPCSASTAPPGDGNPRPCATACSRSPPRWPTREGAPSCTSSGTTPGPQPSSTAGTGSQPSRHPDHAAIRPDDQQHLFGSGTDAYPQRMRDLVTPPCQNHEYETGSDAGPSVSRAL